MLEEKDMEKPKILTVLLVSLILAANLATLILFAQVEGSTKAVKEPVSVFAASSYSIELEEFRWNKFSLKVLVNMNQWSSVDYAAAVHEALDSWVMSIRDYNNLFGEALRIISFAFYMSNINLTSNFDIFITFTPNEIPPTSHVVGLTTYSWNRATHEPVPPVTINITTYSSTADHLFVKNVAMHELGHALGLGHASSQSTADRTPELMYYSSSKDQVVYPSTLDLYGLTKLYQGSFGQSVQLPSSIPYKMLSGVSPTAVTVSVRDITENDLKLTWTQSPDSNFARYEIFRSTAAGVLGTSIANITNKATTSLTVSSLTSEITYYFTVRVWNTKGLYADSVQISMTIFIPMWRKPWFIGYTIVVIIVFAALAVLIRRRKSSMTSIAS